MQEGMHQQVVPVYVQEGMMHQRSIIFYGSSGRPSPSSIATIFYVHHLPLLWFWCSDRLNERGGGRRGPLDQLARGRFLGADQALGLAH